MKIKKIFLLLCVFIVIAVFNACSTRHKLNPSAPIVYTPYPTSTPVLSVTLAPPYQTATTLITNLPHKSLYQAVQTEAANIVNTAVNVATLTPVPNAQDALEAAVTTVANAYATAECMVSATELATAVSSGNAIATEVIRAIQTQQANVTMTFIPTVSGNVQDIFDVISDAAATQEAIQTLTPVQTIGGLYALGTAAANAAETVQIIATQTVVPAVTGDADAIATQAVLAYETAEAQITATLVPTLEGYNNEFATAVATLTPTWIYTQAAQFGETAIATAEAIASSVATPGVEAAQTAVALIAYNGLTYNMDDPEYPQFDDTLSVGFFHSLNSFWIGKKEVTYELWYQVKQWALSHGYVFTNSGREGNDGVIGAAPGSAMNEPVTGINWRDSIVWCNAFSELQSMEPCYTFSGSIIKDSTNITVCDNAVCNWNVNGYRLPTEGEWQYAAMWHGNDSSDGAVEWPSGSGVYWAMPTYASGATESVTYTAQTGLVAWYDQNSGMVTHNTGSKLPNALGIYDMSGNVSEWCWDWNGPYPTDYYVTNYRGAASGSQRIVRGGSYYGTAAKLQLGYRSGLPPGSTSIDVGFRVVRSQ